MTEQKMLLAGALIGLARSLDETNSTPVAYICLLAGLDSLNSGDDSAAAEMTERVHAQKQIAVPDCAVCLNPCGRTFDYDLNELSALPEQTQQLKLQLLSTLAEAGSRLAMRGDDAAVDWQTKLKALCSGLFAIGYEWYEPQQLKAKIGEIEQL